MTLPTPDEQIKKLSKEFNKEELKGLNLLSTSYGHEIVWYGIEAVAHTYLMQRAKSISEGKVSLESFIQKYELNFKDVTGSSAPGFHGSLKVIENDGIFIPQHAYWFFPPANDMFERIITYFSGDYSNRIRREAWVNKDYARILAFKSVWQPSDLESPEVAGLGVQFGKDMWQTCVKGFEEQTQKKEQPPAFKNLGKGLIEYYSKIVNGLDF